MMFDPLTHGLVLDIDDTICNTAHTCMELMATEFGLTAPFDTDTLWQTYLQPYLVPEWQTPEVSAWLDQHLLDPDFLINLPPLELSLQSLQRITQLVPVSLYLTSRDSRNQAVTQAWLDKHGFPPAPLVTRPTKVIDPVWKVRYLTTHYPDTMALIDNEVHTTDHDTYQGYLIQLQPFVEHAHLNPRVTNLHTWEDFEVWLRTHVEGTPAAEFSANSAAKFSQAV